MEWYQVLMIVLSVFGMGWVMYANLGNKIDRLSENIVKEMRDFHGRLCSLEEKYKQTPWSVEKLQREALTKWQEKEWDKELENKKKAQPSN